ncbi:nucleotide-binding universal stress protein, UspA family [Desulfuromonas soudanensis]|uniref:Nucleotide-binding universal stress protein, UspA family n=1 Tax=Desulfuromonas soudanensis TaxID=1603606 RepID=A0A0M4D1D5_9BACT|nr:universal stress protein [Desulfuromonas soudanensis]ALC16584.1 nucleotide-binding universal stress protein, UspA family [Desulfuromonas soudanensis]
MKEISRILVISRMTPYCRDAIHYGLSLARKYKGELFILHLLANPGDIIGVNASGLFPLEEYNKYRDIQQKAKDELDQVIKQEIKDGFPIKELISDHDPVDEILHVVKEENIDLIVMLAHEEGHLEHTLFGREKDDIISSLPCSILLVKKEPEPVKR